MKAVLTCALFVAVLGGANLTRSAETGSVEGATALHQAVDQDDVAAVRALLAAGANPNAVSRVGAITPLSLACTNGDAAVIEALLKAGADPNQTAADGTTVLMTAAAAGQENTLRLLLNNGARVDTRETAHGQTALMFAAAQNRAAAIRLLISRGADWKPMTDVVSLERPRVDEDGNPLPASPAGAVPAGRTRENLGGQARGTAATVTGGMTALLFAAREGHREAIRALLESGADVNQVSGGEKTSPLVIAICNGHYDAAHDLIDHGANPNLATIDGLAALYAVIDTEWAQVGWAPNPITSQETTTYLDLAKLLLDHGADPNAQLAKALWFRPTSHNQEWIDKKGATPFWRAAQSSDVAAMKLLAAGGADPNKASAEGVTPLMVAAGLGWGANASRNVPGAWMDAVAYCVEQKADVAGKDMFGYTALHGAAYRGDNEMVRYLVAHGAPLDPRSKRGQTVTDMANGPMVNAHLPMEHLDTVALLQKLGAPAPEAPVAGAVKPAPKVSAAAPSTPLVDFELMTWPEVKQALAQGKTTALIFNGGTEQRGPQGVNGAHTLIVRELGREIAVKLGDAILAPVMPFSVNKADAQLPGTIGITGLLFAELNRQVAEQMITNGFKNIVLMGDHGGGQQELAEVAATLDAKHRGEGVRVVYCGNVYTKVGDDFNRWLAENGYPPGAHASIKDTSELLYLGGEKGWVRKEQIAAAVGDPVLKRGETKDPNAKRVNNGIMGDARRSSPEIGKRVSDMKVEYAVSQIRELLKRGE